MLHPRINAANIMIGHGEEEAMHIFGGQFTKHRTTDTTEIIAPGKQPIAGPNMPREVMDHCMVKVNDSLAIYSGGVSERYRREPKTW